MPDNFRSIKDIINQEPGLSGLRKDIINSETLSEFGNIFPELALIVKPIKIENETLFLKVENSVWRSELNLQCKSLIETINSFFKEDRIISIRFL